MPPVHRLSVFLHLRLGRALLTICAIGLADAAHAAVCRVAPDGAGDGSSWAAAASLQGALADAGCDELWLRQGTYTPTTGTDRAVSFAIGRPLKLYGGFSGTETDLSGRSTDSRLTVLSGDIDGNDAVNAQGVTETAAGLVGDNSYHVVTIGGIGDTGAGGPYTRDNTVLDGLTITGGWAGELWPPHSFGGGLFCNGSGDGNVCSPTLANLGFSGNRAYDSGGAIYNGAVMGGASSPVIVNATFSGNSSDYYGGAIYNDGSGEGEGSRPLVVNATFSGNAAFLGGAIYSAAARPTITHTTFSGNAADYGGAIYNSTGSNTTIAASILWGNTAASERGSQIFCYDATVTVSASIVQDWDDGGIGNDGDSYTADGGGNLDADPRLGALTDNGGPTPTMALRTGSPAYLAGGANPEPGVFTDQRGLPRGSVVSIGAWDHDPVGLGLSSVVTTTQDGIGLHAIGGAELSLREAIWHANRGDFGPAPAIGFDFEAERGSPGPAVITLTEGELLITASQSIDGGEAGVVIDANADGDGDPATYAPAVDDTDPVNQWRVMRIVGDSSESGVVVRLDHLTLTGGNVYPDGGNMYPGTPPDSQGGILFIEGDYGRKTDVTLVHSTVSGGRASTGGGIWNTGKVGGNATLAISNSVIAGNTSYTAGGLGSDAGNYSGRALATIADSTVEGNTTLRDSGPQSAGFINDGGGLYNAAGWEGSMAEMRVSGSTIANNRSATSGGGINNFAASGGNAILTLHDSIVRDNAAGAGGGIRSWVSDFGNSSVTIDGSEIIGNMAGEGGGIFNTSFTCCFDPPGLAELTITNSTLADNSASSGGGGAIFNYAVWQGYNDNDAPVTIVNSTLTGNTAIRGGAISVIAYLGHATLTLESSTIAGNRAIDIGGGILVRECGLAETRIGGSILSGNSDPLRPESDYSFESCFTMPVFTSLGGNLYGSNGDAGGVTDALASDTLLAGSLATALRVDDDGAPLLADHGGPTRTVLPAAGGAAIDALECDGLPATDQRGVARPQGPACDIGAAERSRATLAVSATGQGRVDSPASPAPQGAPISACTASGGVCSATYLEAETVTLEATPATGWHFVEWGGDCDASGSATLIAGESCTALFGIDQYTVSFDPQGGSAVDPIVQDYQSTVTVPAGPLREGYGFVHWNTAPDGSGTAYAPGDTFPMPLNGLTLYAQWAINVYTVTAHAPGGHGQIAPETQGIEHGSPASFALTPAPGYHAAPPFGGDCPAGELDAAQYLIAAITAACGVEAYFAQNPPAAASAQGGSGQSATVHQGFAAPLAVRVTDADGNPLEGIAVAFASPGEGASASFAAVPEAALGVLTEADGIARVAATANAIAGEYEVTATVEGIAEPVAFALSNEALVPELTLTAIPAVVPTGQPVTLNLAVQGVNPTGTADFVLGDGAASCPGVALADGAAACEIDGLPPGAYTVTAGYSGDASHAPGQAQLRLLVQNPMTVPAASPWLLAALALLLAGLGARRRGE